MLLQSTSTIRGAGLKPKIDTILRIEFSLFFVRFCWHARSSHNNEVVHAARAIACAAQCKTRAYALTKRHRSGYELICVMLLLVSQGCSNLGGDFRTQEFPLPLATATITRNRNCQSHLQPTAANHNRNCQSQLQLRHATAAGNHNCNDQSQPRLPTTTAVANHSCNRHSQPQR